MKRLLLVCEGLAGEPLEELGGRTPLEAAKKPRLDAWAKKGRLGTVLLSPPALAPTPDVACLSALGYDPEEFYTGPAPLEAISAGLAQTEGEVAFRCDFVTASEGRLVDPTAGTISAREAKLLVEELNRKLGSERVRFIPVSGHRNLLMVRSPDMADELDEWDAADPRGLVGEKLLTRRPRGKAAELLSSLVEGSRSVLEDHEINRVRIDLKENPANMIWLWGQGRRPKCPSFRQRFGVEGGVLSASESIRGLAGALGLKVLEDLEKDWGSVDFALVHQGAGNAAGLEDPRCRVKLIEDFDAGIAAKAAALCARSAECRVAVLSDALYSHAQKKTLRGHVPFLVQGEGIGPGETALSEKAASQSPLIVEKGHQWMERFLSKKGFE